MGKLYRYVKILVLAWALHRISMAVIGFSKFTLAEFNWVEFVVDFGVYLAAFAISYWLIIRSEAKVMEKLAANAEVGETSHHE